MTKLIRKSFFIYFLLYAAYFNYIGVNGTASYEVQPSKVARSRLDYDQVYEDYIKQKLHNNDNIISEYSPPYKNSIQNIIKTDQQTQRPNIQSQYIYRNIQTGSAILPQRGIRVHISPETNKTISHIARVDTTIISPKRSNLRKPNKINHRNDRRISNGKQAGRMCVKCPPEKTVIAQKGLDGVLIVPPPVLTCTNQVLPSTSQYEIQTLFGPNFMFVLPQGQHTFIGKIYNKKTNLPEQTCLLRYKVIVRQCGRYHPRSSDLKMRCDLASIWGSRCSFHCRENGILSHSDSIYCGDNLVWEGEEPSCFYSTDYQHDSEVTPPVIEIHNKNCEMPVPPENNKISCEIQNETNNDDADITDDITPLTSVPEGSTCRLRCTLKNHEIPKNHFNKSVLRCDNGQWNTTAIDLCQPIRLTRHRRPFSLFHNYHKKQN